MLRFRQALSELMHYRLYVRLHGIRQRGSVRSIWTDPTMFSRDETLCPDSLAKLEEHHVNLKREVPKALYCFIKPIQRIRAFKPSSENQQATNRVHLRTTSSGGSTSC